MFFFSFRIHFIIEKLASVVRPGGFTYVVKFFYSDYSLTRIRAMVQTTHAKARTIYLDSRSSLEVMAAVSPAATATAAAAASFARFLSLSLSLSLFHALRESVTFDAFDYLMTNR